MDEYIPDVRELEQAGLSPNEASEAVNDTAEEIEALIERQVRRKRGRPWYKRSYGAGVVRIGKDKIQVKAIKAAEVYAWYRDYVSLFYHDFWGQTSTAGYQSYRLALKYAWENFKFFRAVRERLDTTYGGWTTETETLVMDILKPKDFNLNSWDVSLTAGSTLNFIPNATGTFTVNSKGGFSIFGVQDLGVKAGYQSPVDDIIITKNNITYSAKHLEFNVSDNGLLDLGRFFAWIPTNMTGDIDLYSANGGDTTFRLVGIVLTLRSNTGAGAVRAIEL